MVVPDGGRARNVRVVLVEDCEFMREALHAVFELDGGIELVGETDDGDVAVEMARRLRPDVVVTDIAHHGADGFDLTARILEQDPAAKVLLHSAYGAAADFRRAYQVGARGYVVKGDPGATLTNAVRRIAAGGVFVSPSFPRR